MTVDRIADFPTRVAAQVTKNNNDRISIDSGTEARRRRHDVGRPPVVVAAARELVYAQHKRARINSTRTRGTA